MELKPRLSEHVKKFIRISWSRRIGAGMLSTLCLVGLAVSGCQPHSATRNPASAYFLLPLGTTVTLHERLDIGPRRARIFLQDGTVRRSTNISLGLSEYAPHCHFSVNDVLEVAQVIEPDTFTVTRVRRLDFQQVVDGLPVGAVLVAMVGGDGPGDVFHARRFELDSPRQPQVRALICAGALDDPVDARPPTLAEIRRALGAIVTVTLPQPPAGSW